MNAASLSNYLSLAVVMVFAQNIVFSYGLGTDELLRITARPKEFTLFGCILTFFTVTGALGGMLVDDICAALNITGALYTGKAFGYLLFLVAAYLITTLILRRFFHSFYRYISRALPMAVFGTATLGAPLILSRISQTTLDIIFTNHYAAGLVFGLSAGIGYLLAMLLLYEGMRQIEAMDLPEAFRGLPARFIYVGLLALAFVGISGRALSI